MQIEYIVREDNTRLLLIFAGWSTDASAFGGLVCPGYDVAVLSGYTDLSVPDDFYWHGIVNCQSRLLLRSMARKLRYRTRKGYLNGFTGLHWMA